MKKTWIVIGVIVLIVGFIGINIWKNTTTTSVKVETETLTEEVMQETVMTPGTLKLQDRKSTRLNSSHVAISYAVFCLKKKKKSNKGAWTSDDTVACSEYENRNERGYDVEMIRTRSESCLQRENVNDDG